MKSRMFGMLIASLGAMSVVLVANESFATSRARASSHMTSHRAAAHFFRHHHRPDAAVAWPGFDDSFYAPTGQPTLDGVPPQASGGAPNANTNEIPWDWPHRYPPVVMPSARPYVSSCAAETVTVPDGRGGQGQVNVTRCY